MKWLLSALNIREASRVHEVLSLFMLKLCLEKPDTVLRLILTFMGLEGKFPLLGSGFTTQLSAHSNEIHPKQRGSVRLLVLSQVLCRGPE